MRSPTKHTQINDSHVLIGMIFTQNLIHNETIPSGFLPRLAWSLHTQAERWTSAYVYKIEVRS